jgi:hypothetical protein
MRFQTGIALSRNTDHETIVSAVTWYKHPPTQFSTRGFTLAQAKKLLLATVVTYNKDSIAAVNAACHRTLESLLIKQKTPPGTSAGVELIVRPTLAKHRYILPSKKLKTHWLLNAADAVLLAWKRGER